MSAGQHLLDQVQGLADPRDIEHPSAMLSFLRVQCMGICCGALQRGPHSN